MYYKEAFFSAILKGPMLESHMYFFKKIQICPLWAEPCGDLYVLEGAYVGADPSTSIWLRQL